MRICSVRHIDGPNLYIYRPILIADVDLEDLTERESREFPGFNERLLAEFPGLCEHHCAKGEPGGFVERLHGGTYFGHIVEHLAIELACCVGIDVHYGKTLYAGGPGQYEIVMECKAYRCQRYLLEAAMWIVESILAGKSYSLDDIMARAEEILRETALGPSTQAIVDAATQRGIPVRRLNEGSLVQLGHGKKRKLVQATLTDNTSAVAVDIASDKSLTKEILGSAGIPVPHGGWADDEEEAVAQFRRLRSPVVIKPYNGNQGRGVSLNLVSEEEVRLAYRFASRYNRRVIVERYVEGKNIRLLVVAGKLAAASERIPPTVRGDGYQSVRQLVAEVNAHPNRGADHEKPLTRIPMDEVAEQVLARQGLSPDDVPASGRVVLLRDSANLSTGGEAVDVTGQLDETYRLIAERAARLVGLDVCGIDMIVPAIHRPPQEDEECAVVEVNAAPGIRMHQHPSYGVTRDVAQAIVNSLFPGRDNGRIPLVSVTGTNGKTTITRLIGHGLAATGRTVGMTTTGGVFIGGKQVLSGDTTGPASARLVLSDPSVEAAVLETARGGIVRGGLAYDRANVAVLTNITLDHIGQDHVETIEDLVHIKSLVAECVSEDGTVVLNAEDKNLVELAPRLSSKIVFFATSPDNPVLRRHLAGGGVGFFLQRGWLTEGRGNLNWEIAFARDIPVTMDGKARFQIENCLAAAAALRSLGLTRRQVADALLSFRPEQDNPGRLMTYRMQGGCFVVLDYGHNPDGFRRVGEWLKRIGTKRIIGVVGVPGDRADEVIRQAAAELSQWFDAFIVKEDADKRGRREGEVAHMVAGEIRRLHPEKPCAVVLSEPDALRQAIAAAKPGEVVVAFYEKLDPLQQVIESLGGMTVSAISAHAPDRAVATV
ncbi:cyanophycin synthetase [Alicyclobacillus herbarius]|uniref:cyanophycin synthetase n=1 Tax=Alicyclobacillus herbarius TaxID=122960 RepID=UPI0004072795|nr:cyanophycin synthetase [Alicyclobacillus herbarius]